jgi:hypothetical protein
MCVCMCVCVGGCAQTSQIVIMPQSGHKKEVFASDLGCSCTITMKAAQHLVVISIRNNIERRSKEEFSPLDDDEQADPCAP